MFEGNNVRDVQRFGEREIVENRRRTTRRKKKKKRKKHGLERKKMVHWIDPLERRYLFVRNSVPKE